MTPGILAQCRALALSRLQRDGSDGMRVTVTAHVLTLREALGAPGRQDYPLQTGREYLLEALCGRARGQAFTDAPAAFEGSLAELLTRDGADTATRALQVAALNALLCRQAAVTDTVHCRDEGPARCAQELPAAVRSRWPRAQMLALVGCQPAMAEALAPHYHLTVIDADQARIGTQLAGTEIIGSNDRRAALVLREADAVLATGSTLVNGTIDGLIALVGLPRLLFYGVTIAGAAGLLNLPRFCAGAEQGAA